MFHIKPGNSKKNLASEYYGRSKINLIVSSLKTVVNQRFHQNF